MNQVPEPEGELDVESAIVRMRATAQALGEARINALGQARNLLEAPTAAAIEFHTDVVRNMDRVEPTQASVAKNLGRGFRVAGQVIMADGNLSLAGMRLRIVDASGQVLLERPDWISDPDGHFAIELTATEAKANASHLVELADNEGNPLQRLDRVVSAGESVEANVALELPPDGSVLAMQVAVTKARLDEMSVTRARQQTHIEALKARQVMDQIAIDTEIANVRAALNSLSG